MAGFKRNHFPVAMRLAWIVKRLSMTLLEGCIIIMSGLQALPGQDIALTLQSSQKFTETTVFFGDLCPKASEVLRDLKNLKSKDS